MELKLRGQHESFSRRHQYETKDPIYLRPYHLVRGVQAKRGITSDQSFHTLDLLEINDAATGPVFLHDVVIIGSAADEKFYVDSDQYIELVVSVNMRGWKCRETA